LTGVARAAAPAGFAEAAALGRAATDAFARLDGEGVAETLARLPTRDVSSAAFAPPAPAAARALVWLDAALGAARAFDRALADALAAAAPLLRWDEPAYPADAVGAGFAARVAWADWLGPAGFFPGDDAASGFLLMAPDTVYPDHWHPAPELYLPLTGPSLWGVDGGALVEKPAGARIWHAPRRTHATTALGAPLLALYAWPRDAAAGPFLGRAP
jgi:hypothetical protein